MKFDAAIDAKTLNNLINNTPGVVEHGIFYSLTSALLIATDGVVKAHWA
jgi:ribose 5-phosphate isomerase A